jgi:hypothetical protein
VTPLAPAKSVRQEAPVPAEMLRQIEQHLWPDGYSRSIWMIVDAARDRRIFGLILECFYLNHSCLFAGRIAPELQIAAPYLVRLTYDDAKTRMFLKQAWGNSWGVFVKCDGRIEALRRHLRTFLLVRDERDNRFMFRYFDPRILRVYLPTCRKDELRTVYGPIERFVMEDGNPETLLEFNFDGAYLDVEKHPLRAVGVS